MIRDFTFSATTADHGERLDRVVAVHCPGTTRAFVLEAIAHGDVLLNNQTAPKGLKLRTGDRILVRTLLEASDKRVLPDAKLPLDVIFQDAALIVLNKPAGMPVHPLVPGETGTLANALVAREPALADIGDDPLFPALAHRLDTDTSGVVVAARTVEAYTLLRAAFHNHEINKEYRALVRGSPPDSGRLQHYLAHEPANRGRMRVFQERPAVYAGPRLMQAVTEFQVLERLTGYTLLSVRIPTGVTHQIRAQLSAAGFAVVADRLYGGPRAEGELDLTRHFLHAAAIGLTHPATGQPVRFEAPLAAELQSVLGGLRKRSTFNA